MRNIFTLVFLLFFFGVHKEAKTETTAGPAKKPVRNQSVPSSGELSTKNNHRCTWQTSGEGEVSLLVNCQHGEESYVCRYAGKPDLCPSYQAWSSKYWKQVVSKLKRKRNACEEEKVLKARICKNSPTEVHMRLVEKTGGEKKEGKGVEKGKQRGTRKEPATVESEKMEKYKSALGEVNDGTSDLQPVENYCAEQWHVICTFFVKFFDG